jgi:hypothetical protein
MIIVHYEALNFMVNTAMGETLSMSVVPIAPVAKAGLKRKGAPPAEVKVSNTTEGRSSRDSDDRGMWPTRKILPT